MVTTEFDTGDNPVYNINKIASNKKLVIQKGPIIYYKRIITISGDKDDVKGYIESIQSSYIIDGEPNFYQNTPWIRATLNLIKK